MKHLQNIEVIASAKLQAILMGFFGLLAGLIYAVGGFFYDLVITSSVNIGTALAFLAVFGMPVIFAAFGFLTGLVGALIYNSAAKLIHK